jgi:hypothetical protein
MGISFIAGYDANEKSRATRRSNIRKTPMDDGTNQYTTVAETTLWAVDAKYVGLSFDEKNALLTWLETNETAEINLPVGSDLYIGYIDPETQIDSRTMSNAALLWQVSFGFDGERI